MNKLNSNNNNRDQKNLLSDVITDLDIASNSYLENRMRRGKANADDIRVFKINLF
jgi:hypothetical protein